MPQSRRILFYASVFLIASICGQVACQGLCRRMRNVFMALAFLQGLRSGRSANNIENMGGVPSPSSQTPQMIPIPYHVYSDHPPKHHVKFTIYHIPLSVGYPVPEPYHIPWHIKGLGKTMTKVRYTPKPLHHQVTKPHGTSSHHDEHKYEKPKIQLGGKYKEIKVIEGHHGHDSAEVDHNHDNDDHIVHHIVENVAEHNEGHHDDAHGYELIEERHNTENGKDSARDKHYEVENRNNGKNEVAGTRDNGAGEHKKHQMISLVVNYKPKNRRRRK